MLVSPSDACCLIRACGGGSRNVCACGSVRGSSKRPVRFVPRQEVTAVNDGKCAMKKPAKNAKGDVKRLPCPDEELAAAYPQVVEYLSCVKYDDGSPRTPSALSLFLEDGVVKLAMNDKDCNRSLYVAAQGLQEALGLMERALSDPQAPWRGWKRGK